MNQKQNTRSEVVLLLPVAQADICFRPVPWRAA